MPCCSALSMLTFRSLYLNVWAPVNATSRSNLPVKTWIHGGGFRAGGTSVPLYNGCNLATDAVVVTIAYRLGPLGFLNIESAGIPGNMGLQDLMLGLQWIQDNVSAFGGDPVGSRKFIQASKGLGC